MNEKLEEALYELLYIFRSQGHVKVSDIVRVANKYALLPELLFRFINDKYIQW